MELFFSEASFWKEQKEFYIKMGLRAWAQQGVPSFPTSNPFFAKKVAEVVSGFAKDVEEIHILELAGGTGKFAYLLIQELKKIIDKPFTYILTDISPSLLAFWRAHPLFERYVKEGILSFALFDPVEKVMIDLPSGPLFVVANYFFDSIPVEVVKVENGSVYRELFEPSGQYIPFEHPLVNKEQQGFALLPTSVFKTVETLLEMTGGEMALLVSDYGNYEENYEKERPGFCHKGTISFPVNFHFIQKFAEQKGALSLLPQRVEEKFVVQLNLFGNRFEHTQAAFETAMNPFNPGSYCVLVQNLEGTECSLEEIAHYFQLSNFDPVLVTLFSTRILELLPHAPKAIHTLFEDIFEHVHHQLFITCQMDSTTLFSMALLLYAICSYEKAILFYKRSLCVLKENPLAYLHMGLSYKALGKEEEALLAIEPVKTIDLATYEKQRDLILTAL